MVGSAADTVPSSTSRTGAGTSSSSATVASTMVGVPQPIRAAGPTTWRPWAAGKYLARSVSTRAAWAAGSSAKKMSPMPSPRSAARNASVSTRRWIPISPPTPSSVKPRPSWIGWNCAEMIAASE